MGIVWTIVIGLVVGLLARLVMPGKDAHGLIVTTLLGIGGSVVAKYAGQAIGWYAEGEAAGWIASVLGAVVILAVARLLKQKQAT